jgi:S-adenosylmethionine:tRNA ribosyltransferase-isomerase
VTSWFATTPRSFQRVWSGEKEDTHGKVEVLLLNQKEGDVWECLNRQRPFSVKVGTVCSFGDGELKCTCVKVLPEGIRHMEFHYQGIFLEILDQLGKMPLAALYQKTMREQ